GDRSQHLAEIELPFGQRSAPHRVGCAGDERRTPAEHQAEHPLDSPADLARFLVHRLEEQGQSLGSRQSYHLLPLLPVAQEELLAEPDHSQWREMRRCRGTRLALTLAEDWQREPSGYVPLAFGPPHRRLIQLTHARRSGIGDFAVGGGNFTKDRHLHQCPSEICPNLCLDGLDDSLSTLLERCYRFGGGRFLRIEYLLRKVQLRLLLR